jgi:HAD superfamily hydrolase (TIGR01484 family)
MRYIALATDYDGTLATQGVVPPDIIAALERLRGSGRRLVMVTGRERPDLERVFDRLDLFDLVVAENGATIYAPASKEERLLAEPPPAVFAAQLRERGVEPISVGRVIVATWEPHQHAVLEVIHRLGLEMQVIFNKGAVMVLPSGVNKATGLQVALRQLGISLHNTVGIGDAENDHAFLRICEVGVAVANALPSVKAEVDLVTEGARGAGVRELADALIADDLAALRPPARHMIELGTTRDGAPVSVYPGSGVLIAGQSGSGKSTTAVALLERFHEKCYQFCLVDPEGDHEGVFEEVAYIGSPARAPTIEEIVGLCAKPGASVAVNLLGVKLADRPAFFASLMPQLLALRAKSGAPHWIVVDEAHHMLPAERALDSAAPPPSPGLLLITLHPGHVSRDVLQQIDVMIGVGAQAHAVIEELCGALGLAAPAVEQQTEGEVLVYDPRTGQAQAVRVTPSRAQHMRHRRKYAQGDLGEDRSFYFRGPGDQLNLQAQNLFLFLQIGDGVDDATWDYHLRNGDYESWLQDSIKDPELADAVAQVALDRHLDPKATRQRVRELVEARYTAPA